MTDPNRALGIGLGAIEQGAPELVRLILMANTQLGTSPHGLALFLLSLLAAGRQDAAETTAGQMAAGGHGEAVTEAIPSLIEALGGSAPATESIAALIGVLGGS